MEIGLKKRLLGAVIIVIAAAACDPAPPPAQSAASSTAAPAVAHADTVYRNARIYTVEPGQPWAEALAIREGRLLAVGDAAAVQTVTGPATRIVDLGGRMVMPGIIDTHVHPMDAGRKELLECGFPFSLGMPDILRRVQECAASTPKGEWVRGGQWSAELLGGDRPPHRAVLDAVVPDHPVFLMDSTVHNAWLNSKALQQLGINQGTPDPNGGTILRDAETGEPTGILLDKAAYQVMQKLPAFSAQQYEDAIRWSVTSLNAVGVTAMKDAQADHYTVSAYRDTEHKGALTMRVAASLPWKNSWTETHEQEQQNIAARGELRSALINNHFIKMFLDGIPPTRTAAFLDPYLPDATHQQPDNGKLIYTPEELSADVTALDAQGFTIKIHATGDRSVRTALDAFESARKSSGRTDRRHEVSHAEAISEADLPRFAALNITAEMSPILWYPSPLVDSMDLVLGRERLQKWWPIRSLLESGARVTYGSDWPSVVPSPSPWPGIEAMVTRADPYGEHAGTQGVDQAIDLAQALRIFTLAGAEALYLENETGSLKPGKFADFIVLDRNLFDIPPEQIGDTQVRLTVLGGREVRAVE
ncbi:MAG: amidohydrolase [Gammaproteobacteria bacterium]|nr:amidohydrolase [Gammaproteobacteria bacterium]